MALLGFAALLTCLCAMLPGMTEAGERELRGTGNQAGVGWHHRDVPNPMEVPQICHLNIPGKLCDVDKILSSDGRARILALLEQVSKEPCLALQAQKATRLVWPSYSTCILMIG